MIEHLKLEDLLFLDIETVSAEQVFTALDAEMQQLF